MSIENLTKQLWLEVNEDLNRQFENTPESKKYSWQFERKIRASANFMTIMMSTEFQTHLQFSTE